MLRPPVSYPTLIISLSSASCSKEIILYINRIRSGKKHWKNDDDDGDDDDDDSHKGSSKESAIKTTAIALVGLLSG